MRSLNLLNPIRGVYFFVNLTYNKNIVLLYLGGIKMDSSFNNLELHEICRQEFNYVTKQMFGRNSWIDRYIDYINLSVRITNHLIKLDVSMFGDDGLKYKHYLIKSFSDLSFKISKDIDKFGNPKFFISEYCYKEINNHFANKNFQFYKMIKECEFDDCTDVVLTDCKFYVYKSIIDAIKRFDNNGCYNKMMIKKLSGCIGVKEKGFKDCLIESMNIYSFIPKYFR